jgi:hypothetical protein
MSEARRCGEAVAASAGELARAWRSGRAGGRRAAPPGLVDGVVESFLEEAGKALAAGLPPGDAWRATTGVLRLRARGGDEVPVELDREWTLVQAVLASACEALESAEAAGWLDAAVDAAREGTRALARGEPHPGIAIVRSWPAR